jgi:hypothetical protein
VRPHGPIAYALGVTRAIRAIVSALIVAHLCAIGVAVTSYSSPGFPAPAGLEEAHEPCLGRFVGGLADGVISIPSVAHQRHSRATTPHDPHRMLTEAAVIR